MNVHRLARIATGFAFLLVLPPGNAAWALTDEQVFRDLDFNFVNPGARALGMGGAFIALGGDVTAGAANPAALHGVGKMELLADYRAARPQGDTVGGDSIDLGALPVELPLIDLASDSQREDQESLSFLGFALPLKRGRTTLSLSRNVVLDTGSTLDGAANRLRFAFADYPLWVNPNGGGTGAPAVEQYAVQSTTAGRMAAELVRYDLSAGIDIGSDFSIGATASLAELDVQSTLQSTVSDPRGVLTTINPRVDADQDGLFDDVVTTSSVNGSDSAVGFSLGLHYHPDSRFSLGRTPVRFGLVYHRGAELSVRQQQTEGSLVTATFDNVLKVPDRIGAGVAGELGPMGAVRLALDVEHVKYSDLLEGFRSGAGAITGAMVDRDSLGLDPDAEVRFDVDDAIVVRAGAEYGFDLRSDWKMAVRAGGYSAPDDRIRMTAFNSTDPAINQAYLDAFAAGSDETHVTAGVSVHSPKGFQFHIAGDFAGDGDQLLFTMRDPFGKPRR